MKLVDKMKKIKGSLRIDTDKKITSDKGKNPEFSTVYNEKDNNRPVITATKKDGDVLESSATQDAQESGEYEKAMKKIGAKKEDIKFTSPSMAVAQAAVQSKKTNKEKDLDNDKESKKESLVKNYDIKREGSTLKYTKIDLQNAEGTKIPKWKQMLQEKNKAKSAKFQYDQGKNRKVSPGVVLKSEHEETSEKLEKDVVDIHSKKLFKNMNSGDDMSLSQNSKMAALSGGVKTAFGTPAPSTPPPAPAPNSGSLGGNITGAIQRMGKADGDEADRSRIRKMIDDMKNRKKMSQSKQSGVSREDKIKAAMAKYGRGEAKDDYESRSFTAPTKISTKEKAENAKEEMASRAKGANEKIKNAEIDKLLLQAHSAAHGPEAAQHLENIEELKNKEGSGYTVNVPGHYPVITYYGEKDGKHYFSGYSKSKKKHESYVIENGKLSHIPNVMDRWHGVDFDSGENYGNALPMDQLIEKQKQLHGVPSKSVIAAIKTLPKASELLGKKVRPLDQPHPRDFKVRKWHSYGDSKTQWIVEGKRNTFTFHPKYGDPGTYTMHDYDVESSTPEKLAQFSKVFEHVLSQNKEFKAAHPEGARYEHKTKDNKPGLKIATKDSVASTSTDNWRPHFDEGSKAMLDKKKRAFDILSNEGGPAGLLAVKAKPSHLKVIKSMPIQGLFKSCEKLKKAMDDGDEADRSRIRKMIDDMKNRKKMSQSKQSGVSREDKIKAALERHGRGISSTKDKKFENKPFVNKPMPKDTIPLENVMGPAQTDPKVKRKLTLVKSDLSAKNTVGKFLKMKDALKKAKIQIIGG